ncbi:uncharacterized protein V1518DRAFT_414137 [Limtongia smithiae]|uniref:uncharacterized protein n=1 Tax=Limtongia smithiae TaxID=1125753 RepID=UPI0034CDA00C
MAARQNYEHLCGRFRVDVRRPCASPSDNRSSMTPNFMVDVKREAASSSSSASSTHTLREQPQQRSRSASPQSTRRHSHSNIDNTISQSETTEQQELALTVPPVSSTELQAPAADTQHSAQLTSTYQGRGVLVMKPVRQEHSLVRRGPMHHTFQQPDGSNPQVCTSPPPPPDHTAPTSHSAQSTTKAWSSIGPLKSQVELSSRFRVIDASMPPQQQLQMQGRLPAVEFHPPPPRQRKTSTSGAASATTAAATENGSAAAVPATLPSPEAGLSSFDSRPRPAVVSSSGAEQRGPPLPPSALMSKFRGVVMSRTIGKGAHRSHKKKSTTAAVTAVGQSST